VTKILQLIPLYQLLTRTCHHKLTLNKSGHTRIELLSKFKGQGLFRVTRKKVNSLYVKRVEVVIGAERAMPLSGQKILKIVRKEVKEPGISISL
jgi:hypothetical protein